MSNVVAVLPFKNESYYLPLYLKNVLPVVDKIIAIDDGSTDNGRNILESVGDKIKVYSNTDFVKGGWAEYSIRNKLVQLAREEQAKYIVALDADEAFSTNFVPVARKIFEKLQPGQKLSMQWIALWKSMNFYKNDHSVWSNNFKDFVYCDDGVGLHEDNPNSIGIGRTPGQNTESNWLKLNNKYGCVLHYQFSNWRNFQLKQAWYRINELFLQGKQNTSAINQKYSITLDDPRTQVTECPKEWIKGLNEIIDLQSIPVSWHLDKIKEYIETHGPKTFEGLQIWHINELKELAESSLKQ